MDTARPDLSPLARAALAATLALLLLGAILLGHWLARRGPQPCLSTVSGADPMADWDTRAVWSFTQLDAAPQPGALLRGIMVGTDPDTGYSWQGGQLLPGDRLVSAHRDGVRWGQFPPDQGRQEATGWTFVVRRAGALRTVHLTNSASC